MGTYCLLRAALSFVWSQVHCALLEEHWEHTGSVPSHFIFFRLESAFRDAGSRDTNRHAPAVLTGSPDPPALELDWFRARIRGHLLVLGAFLLAGRGGWLVRVGHDEGDGGLFGEERSFIKRVCG